MFELSKGFHKAAGLFLISLFLVKPTWGGNMPDEAKKALSVKDYRKALGLLLSADGDAKNDPEVLQSIGICYLNIHGDKSKAVPFLEKADGLKKNNWALKADLAKAYQYAGKYKEAIDVYENINKNGGKKFMGQYDREINYCKNAIDAVQNPVNVVITNMGKNINTEFPDYFPIVPEYGNFMAFTSRRKGNTGNIADKDGFFTSDIYLSDFKNGQYQKAKNAGIKTNTPGDEQVTGCTPDGKTLVVYIDYGGSNYGDLFFCENGKNNSTGPLINVGENLNSPAFETAGCFNSDGTTVYFASDLPGGYGGRDIYRAMRLPDGNWADPQNLGPSINSPYNEDFPWISDDGLVLTFSSEGHNSMGGFDLFRSDWDTTRNIWLKPENMGYPVNTSDDEYNICLSRTRETGYISGWRADSQGDWDIYKVTFKDLIPPKTTFVYLTVQAGDSIRPNVSASCIVRDKINGETMGMYTPKRNGKALMILPTGLYELEVSSNGFETYKEDLYLSDNEFYADKLNKTVRMKSSR